MNLFLPELFHLISTNLNDKEKVFLTSCSKITYKFKSLLILDSEYNLEEINDKWRAKNIIIKEFSLKNKIKGLIENSIKESIRLYPKYVKFISDNINIKLFRSEEMIEKLDSYGCNYMAMKIILNNDGSIENINRQFKIASTWCYLSIVELLIKSGADVHSDNDEAIIWASDEGNLYMARLLIKNGANIQARNNLAIIHASDQGHLSLVKLLIDSGADIKAQNNRAIISASRNGHQEIVKILMDSRADI